MAELKYYNFNVNYVSIDLPDPVHVNDQQFAMDHWCQRDFLGYIPNHRYSIIAGYDLPDDYDASVTPAANTHACAWNVKPLFYSDTILPTSQGVTDSTVVGDKYRWRSTMIDLTLNPQRYQDLFKSPALSAHVQAVLNKQQWNTTGALVPSSSNTMATEYTKGVGSGGTITQIDGRVAVVTNSLVNPSNVGFRPETWTQAEYNDPASNGVPVISRIAVPNSSYISSVSEDRNNVMYVGLQEATPTWMLGSPVPLYYENFPLYRMPTYRPFFYCRLVVFKLKFSQNDYQTFRASQYYQNEFLNSIWWNRFDAQGRPNMSVRTNDFNVNTPCGGTFDLKYNKLIQINPFKNYRFRINLYSTSRRGDHVEIRRSNIFAYNAADNYPYYKNAEYCAYLLPPLDVQQDFDAISSMLVSAGSFYDTNNFVSTTSYNISANPQYVYGPYNPFSVPLSIPNLIVPRPTGGAVNRFFPTFLPLCTTKITGRTAYWD